MYTDVHDSRFNGVVVIDLFSPINSLLNVGKWLDAMDLDLLLKVMV